MYLISCVKFFWIASSFCFILFYISFSSKRLKYLSIIHLKKGLGNFSKVTIFNSSFIIGNKNKEKGRSFTILKALDLLKLTIIYFTLSIQGVALIFPIKLCLLRGQCFIVLFDICPLANHNMTTSENCLALGAKNPNQWSKSMNLFIFKWSIHFKI